MLRSTIKRALGIYNIAPSLDFERDPQLDEMMQKSFPSKSNNIGNLKMPEIIVDRDYNPFLEERGNPQIEIQNLTKMYHQNISAEPSKINLFEDEDFDEDLMRLPNGYWLFNKGDSTLMLDLGRMHRLLVAESNKNQKNLQTDSLSCFR